MNMQFELLGCEFFSFPVRQSISVVDEQVKYNKNQTVYDTIEPALSRLVFSMLFFTVPSNPVAGAMGRCGKPYGMRLHITLDPS